jgi:hypothetical protein
MEYIYPFPIPSISDRVPTRPHPQTPKPASTTVAASTDTKEYQLLLNISEVLMRFA